MSSSVEKRLAEQGLTVPEVGKPAGAYTGFVQTGSLVFVSGQVAKDDAGGLLTGRLGEDVDLETGQKAAQSCALQLIAQVKAACGGDLDRVVRVVKLTGFVNASPSFRSASSGDQRRFRADAARLWRGGRACPRCGWFELAAVQCGCRGRRDFRDPMTGASDLKGGGR